jgi:gamma-glutamyltranspeptidase/glutathione hydrolase
MTTGPGLSPNFSRRREVRKPAVRSKGGIVVSQNRRASEVGARVLADGGNAIDAAVATSFAIGVLEPWMSGVGGVGAMLVRFAKDDTVHAIDFGARAPAALNPADYPMIEGSGSDLFGWPRVKDDRNLVGATAVMAPTVVCGVAAAHKAHGSKPWRALVEPAAQLAAEGMVVDWHTTLVTATAFAHLAQDAACRAVFLPNGAPAAPPPAVVSDPIIRLRNPALARTLGTLAAEGPEALYRGALGRALIEDIRAAGGCVSLEDLARCEALTKAPRVIKHRGRAVHVLPELSGGPTTADAFAHLDAHWTPSRKDTLDADAFMAIAAALQQAWAKRFATMGDSAGIAPQSSTTHISVVDRDGNMVALTQTLLSLFGSRFMSPSTGILMNNAVNWFDPRPGGPNSIAAGKRVLANYAPAVMLGDDDAVAIGGCGGRKILPAVFQLLVMMANGMDLDSAFHAPRIDVSGTDIVVMDRDLPEDIRGTLSAGFTTQQVERVAYPYHFTIAGAVRRSGGYNEGATEPLQPWSEAVSEDEL